MRRAFLWTTLAVGACTTAFAAAPSQPDGNRPEGTVIRPAGERFASRDVDEVPDFRKHVVPLLGKLGCNGRACHGSFAGQGGFRLSLFGYDFKLDHEGLLGTGDMGEPRVNLEKPDESLIVRKPTLEEYHEGGRRYDAGSWEHHVLARWIAGGAKSVDDKTPEFVRIDVTPSEILFSGTGQTAPLRAIAVWSDGTREDVTQLCRFKSNNEQVAGVDGAGVVSAGEAGDTHVVVMYDNGVVPIPVIRPVSELAGPQYPDVPAPTKVDELVLQKLRKLGVVPSELSTDAEFLRRVSLDMTGTLPAPQEVEAFLADPSSDKRARKIEELLERPSYVAWWTTKLCDFTGNSDDALVNIVPRGELTASRQWYDWIYKRVAENRPYDEIVTGIVTATSREQGESFQEYCESMSAMFHPDTPASYADRETLSHFWARRNGFRTPNERAIGFAYTFLGIRIQCAECHKHPFDQWTQDDFKQFTGFFGRVQFGTRDRQEYQSMVEELGVGDRRGNQLLAALQPLLRDGKTVPFQEVYVTAARGGRNNNPARNLERQVADLKERLEQLKQDGKDDQARAVQQQLERAQRRLEQLAQQPSGDRAKLLGGDVIDLAEHEDPRLPLMEWLRDKNNPYFARAFVNRVWAAYFNVGIVEPPDDLSLANPPSNEALLEHLAQGFLDSDFDMKWLHREIANSRTYQLSWRPNETNRSDERNFARAVPRRLPAEVAYDALTQATSSDEKFAAMQTDIEGRAIAIPGAGRRQRGAGNSYALMIFGRSLRESNCDCDRSQEASLLQTVFLRNDQELLSMIDDRRGSWLAEVAEELGARFQPQVTAAPENDRARGRERPRNFDQRVRRLREQIQELRQDGKNEEARRLQQELASYTQRFAGGRGNRNAPSDRDESAGAEARGEKIASMDDADIDRLVRQAYLRTLSRYPEEHEVQLAREYIAGADDTINGLRGVLWALLNTKEFIVNH
ncbi:MAG TPA: DUF1549 domain-containing protein [Planctomycetaceae bacterium]|nr:DUF1549 domain-containing protein [Planctomycetaceae bacterium]